MGFVIVDLVKEKAAFLTNSDSGLIESGILQAKYALQSYLAKTDAEVEADTSYTEIQKMLIAYYTAYQLTLTEAGKNLTGVEGEASNVEAPLKSVKADVVETVFGDLSSTNRLLFDTDTLLTQLKSLVCETAMTIGIRLPMCQSDKTKGSPAITFKIRN